MIVEVNIRDSLDSGSLPDTSTKDVERMFMKINSLKEKNQNLEKEIRRLKNKITYLKRKLKEEKEEHHEYRGDNFDDEI